MLPLRELQSAFADALLGGEPRRETVSAPAALADGSALTSLIADDGLAPEARLAIYRHHVTASLTGVLEGVFPVVRRLVDPRFFAYAADAYIRAHPPASPRLERYGAGFADFLRDFPPCRDLAYLPHVAQLEWAMHAAFHAPECEPVDPTQLLELPAHYLVRVVLVLDPSLSLLRSPWPVDVVWQANQEDGTDEHVDLDAGGVRLEVRRAAGVVGMRRLAPGDFALRTALAGGRTLGAAVAAALAGDPQCDVTAALRDLFEQRIAVAFSMSDEQEDRCHDHPHPALVR